MKFKLTILAICCVVVACSPAQAQMEKRMNELYDPANFANAFPAVGQLAPNFDFVDLTGKPTDLNQFRGSTVVLIKAGYT